MPKVSKKAPQIFKVRDPEPDSKFDDIHENLPQMPSLVLIIGSVRSGKSNLLTNFFCNPEMYKDKFDTVRIVSTTLHTDHKGKILDKYFDCSDQYDDMIIENIKKVQSEYTDEVRPTYALVLDDVLTKDFSKSNAVSFFATRFRHYIDMYVIATQSFRAVSGLIRNNATNIIICRLQNMKEREKVAEEYGPMVGGEDNFNMLYDQIHSKPYQYMVLDLQSNPARVIHNFEKVMWQGSVTD
jgi:hypothetical protein